MTTLSSASDVLRCFSAQRLELGVTEVATLLHLPKSNVSRLLRAMREAGFLEAVAGSRRYRPGLLMFELGHTYRRSSPLLARAQAAVERVSRACGHTGYVSIRDGRDVMGLTFHEGSRMLRVGTPVGERLPAFATATGRALLARLDDEVVRALHPDPLTPPSPNSPADLEALIERLHQVRRDGYCVSHHEANAGVASLAVAVGDPATGEEVSLCIVYPVATVPPEEGSAVLAALRAEADRLAALLGDPHRGPPGDPSGDPLGDPPGSPPDRLPGNPPNNPPNNPPGNRQDHPRDTPLGDPPGPGGAQPASGPHPAHGDAAEPDSPPRHPAATPASPRRDAA
ncbi:IclR family transcriptional regulator [Roseomonas elaeocarpi]|uniref:IclR family transcriptional regulator n=1 Tax=Roseomonas elaeocarpi TaxID=907779 RepID=A0ABV6JP21_9PROT